MKKIEFAKISHFELASILFAARWQMQDWQKASKCKENESPWIEPIKATKYIENYLKDFPKDNYYIMTFEKDI